jgi:hypothetical protein
VRPSVRATTVPESVASAVPEAVARTGPKAVRPAAATFPSKDPAIGVLISLFVVGGGQMYAGRTGEGLRLLGASLGAVVVGTTISYSDCPDHGDCNLMPFAIGAGVSVATWIYSIATAPGDVREWNRLQRVASARAVVPTLGTSQGSTRLGLAVRW